MAVLVLVSGLILDQINTNRRLMARNLHQQEVLSVATMAVQTKQDQLTLNGITVTENVASKVSRFMNQERRLFMSLNSKVRAFTLLECLVALLVIAGSIQVYQGLTTVLVSNVKQVKQQENQDWLLFVQQMEAELEGCQLVKVEGNKLYVKQDNQYLAFGLSSASDFRKTNADGRGYQPMLFNVKSSTISQNNQIVTIQVTLKNGLQRSFVYAFEKTG